MFLLQTLDSVEQSFSSSVKLLFEISYLHIYWVIIRGIRQLPVERAHCFCQTVGSPCCSDAGTPHNLELMARGKGVHPCCCWSAASGSAQRRHKIYQIRWETSSTRAKSMTIFAEWITASLSQYRHLPWIKISFSNEEYNIHSCAPIRPSLFLIPKTSLLLLVIQKYTAPHNCKEYCGVVRPVWPGSRQTWRLNKCEGLRYTLFFLLGHAVLHFMQ